MLFLHTLVILDPVRKRPTTHAREFEGQEPFKPAVRFLRKLEGRWFGSAALSIEGVGVTLIYFGLHESRTTASYPAHDHPFAELQYTISGHSELWAGTRHIACRPGTIYVARPGTAHASRWRASSSQPQRTLIIQFELTVNRDNIRPDADLSIAQPIERFYEYFFTAQQDALQLKSDLDDFVLTDLERVLREMKKYPVAAPALISAFWLRLITAAALQIDRAGLVEPQGVVIPLADIELRFRKARALLSDPSQHMLPVHEVARRVGMSVYHFIRKFRQRFGVSPAQYRTRVLLQHAGKLLTQTDDPVYVVAEKVGFSDSSAFAKAFVRQFKIPPLRYRRRYRLRGQ